MYIVERSFNDGGFCNDFYSACSIYNYFCSWIIIFAGISQIPTAPPGDVIVFTTDKSIIIIFVEKFHICNYIYKEIKIFVRFAHGNKRF